MRVLSGPVQLTPSQPQRGGASVAIQERDRKGFAPYFSVGDMSIQRVVGQRIFTPDELFRIYQITPDVRAPIEKIGLRLANTPWVVQPTILKSDPAYDEALDLAAEITAWLERPNTEDDWSEFSQKWAHDLLVYDAFAVERVRDSRGRLQELIEWRGGDVTPLQDEHGRVYSYRQDAALRGWVKFLPEEMDYGNLFPNTVYPNGQPIIETLVEEFITMRAQAQHLRRLVDADEIPPGILALVGVTDVALKRFEAKMKAQQGRDELFRIVSTEDPGGKIEWLQLQRSLKDLEWLPNVREVRKTIWRLFHVTPITMGETDGVPRASAEVQVEITDSGLIGPMLRRSERLVNERWIPARVGNPERAKLIRFAYDTTPDLSQADQEVRAKRLAALTSAHILSVNEARIELGYDAVDDADDPIDRPAEDPVASDDGREARRPGVQRARRPMIRRRSGAVVRGELPSDWQPSGRFRDVRTLPLTRLGGLVREYDDTVTPLYQRCALAVIRAATDAVGDGVLTASEVAIIVGAIGRETSALLTDWSNDTTNLYERAAEVGAATAVGWGGAEVAWRNTAATYQANAIAYLTAGGGKSEGLITTLRRELTGLVLATMARSTGLSRWSVKRTQIAAERGVDVEQVRSDDKLPAALGAFLEAVRRVFDRHQHRIANWSGRLLELANNVASQSLSVPARPETDPEGEPRAEERWMVEWVEVSDDATCPTCRAQGLAGFRYVDQLTTVPGGATECGARCRCVLVYWLESEVVSGTATRLGPIRSRLGLMRPAAP